MVTKKKLIEAKEIMKKRGVNGYWEVNAYEIMKSIFKAMKIKKYSFGEYIYFEGLEIFDLMNNDKNREILLKIIKE